MANKVSFLGYTLGDLLLSPAPGSASRFTSTQSILI